jgi:hypothetical protein
MASVDTARFLADLHALRRIGAFRTGVHRPTYSAEDMESRRWLMARMEEAGLDPVMDGIGNVIGRHRGAGPHLLVGSHIETQNEAGWLDGALGVVAGLALARAGLPVDVVAWADEEGHYGGFIGSRSWIGALEEAEIDRLSNRYTGKTLRQRCARRGWKAARGSPSSRGGTRASSSCTSNRAPGSNRPGCGSAWSPASSRSASGSWCSPASRTTPAAPPWRSAATPGCPPCVC